MGENFFEMSVYIATNMLTGWIIGSMCDQNGLRLLYIAISYTLVVTLFTVIYSFFKENFL